MSAKDDYPDESKRNRRGPQWVEVPVFIHGISPDKFPSSGEAEYKQLLALINEKLPKYTTERFNGEPIYVTWGVPTTPSAGGTDQYLAEVERTIQEKVKEKMGSAYSNPFGLTGYVRDMLFYGISDLFYYVSADGEKDLRKHIFNQISRTLQAMDKESDDYISLTIFGHSAGSVISHDMLYHMFSSKEEHTSEEGAVEDEMDALRKIIKGGRLRIRHLYTFGSPISLLTLRATALVDKFRKGETFAPQNIGLMMGDNLGTPRWVNFWSRYDLASYPVDFLYSNEKGMIEDHEIQTSINPKTAHTGYWTSNEMAEYIAKTF